MELPARRLTGIVLVALFVLATWSELPNAQTSDQSGQPSSGCVADQINSGARRIGEGAERIGEGIKQGAIQTWEAVKAGVSAAANKLPGGKSAPKKTAAPSTSPSTN